MGKTTWRSFWGHNQLIWIKPYPNADTSAHFPEGGSLCNDTSPQESLAGGTGEMTWCHAGKWLLALPGRSWECCQTGPGLGRRHLPNISRTFCSSPCLAEKYNCFGWNRSFLGLQEQGEVGLMPREEQPECHPTLSPPHCHPGA